MNEPNDPVQGHPITRRNLLRLAAAGSATFGAGLDTPGGASPHGVESILPDPHAVELDLRGIGTEEQFYAALKRLGVETNGYANWFTGRWPYISFIGGMVMGCVSEHLQFFYHRTFRWRTDVLDYVLEGGGNVFGLRATIKPYQEKSVFAGKSSYLLWIRCDTLLKTHYPSYILVNNTRVWDCRLHPPLVKRILVPFYLEQAGNPVVDIVVDRVRDPDSQGLAFRMFNTLRLGGPNLKVTLKGAGDRAERSPADNLSSFTFGLFSSGYDFWSDRGRPIADLKRAWLPNFRPAYPTDEIWLSPFTQDSPASGPYHDFMVSYGGCNVLGANPSAATLTLAGSYARGVLASPTDATAARRAFAMPGHLMVHWFGGEDGVLVDDNVRSGAELAARLKSAASRMAAAKAATANPERILAIQEPFPPALTAAHEYQRGNDILVLKNEEDPQYNVLIAMARGAGRSFDKPFGLYWEQTHYPYPSLDFKLQASLLYFLSGASWIGAEAENAPSFANGIAAEWVMPYIQALRFAMVHPSRGEQIVPIGICHGYGDRWWAPYNPLGHMDTFTRHLEYNHATGKLVSEPSIVRRLSYMPEDRHKWSFETAGHLPYFADHIDELKGYDLLDTFIPGFGDAFTANIPRLLTGTPYGPIDFVYSEAASLERMKSYGLLAFLGHAEIDAATGARLRSAVEAGSNLLLGVQHVLSHPQAAFSLEIGPETARHVSGNAGSFHFEGEVYPAPAGWDTVVRVGDAPLAVKRRFRDGECVLFLGRWMHQGGAALRSVLAEMASRAAPLEFNHANDQMEYVAYRKSGGAWIALLNHGAIPVGCDRLRPLRAAAPGPLCSRVTGPWHGRISIKLAKLGLNPTGKWALFEVDGIDGEAFERVISGRENFRVRSIPAAQSEAALHAEITVNKRSQLVIAPPGGGEAVFFGVA